MRRGAVEHSAASVAFCRPWAFPCPTAMPNPAPPGDTPVHQITPTLATDYARDGFVFPIDILSEAEAAVLRAELESAEDEVRADRRKLGLLRGYPARLLPSFDRLIRHPRMV